MGSRQNNIIIDDFIINEEGLPSVIIDEVVYDVEPNCTYIIRDTEETIFIEEDGYPVFLINKENPVIHNPKPNCAYEIQDTSPIINFNPRITFAGSLEKTSSIAYFEPTTGVIGSRYGKIQVISSTVSVIKESLPITFSNAPKIMAFSNNQLVPIFFIKINCINTDYTADTYFYKNAAFPIPSYNSTLQKQFQNLMPSIPVFCSQPPIILDENKPSIKDIEKIFKKFLKYNPDDKLSEQYLHTKTECYIRAHFISRFLQERYHIQTVKVFKSWNVSEWKNFNEKQQWAFHCAPMIITKENVGLMWDPWMTKQLLTFDKWSLMANEPIPYTIMITNSSVIYKGDQGLATSSTFFARSSEKFNYAFQVTASSIPNHPEKNAIRNHYLFFKSRHEVFQETFATTPKSRL